MRDFLDPVVLPASQRPISHPSPFCVCSVPAQSAATADARTTSRALVEASRQTHGGFLTAMGGPGLVFKALSLSSLVAMALAVTLAAVKNGMG